MKVQIDIEGTDQRGRVFLTWAPVRGSLKLLQGPGSGTVDVVLSSAGAVGGLLFDTARTDKGSSTLTLALPGDGTAVPFWVAGEFQKPSLNYGDAELQVKEKSSGSLLGSKSAMVRVRKNAVTLQDAERDRFLAALGTLNARGQGAYRIVRDMHTSDSESEIHGHTAFLPWHRGYVLGLERALQAIDATVAVPYWRFDEPASDLFTRDYMGESDGFDQVVFRPGHALEHWVTDGQAGITRGLDFPLDGPANVITEAQTIARGGAIGDYASFRGMEGNPHGSAHVSFTDSSPISSPPTAVRDPLFFMLHANVDRLWAKWQWVKRRTDTTDPHAYQNGNRVGRRLGDTMWPWNGIHSSPRPPTAPGGPFPQVDWTPAPGPTPKVDDMIDALALKASHSLGFAYDDIPFELPPVVVAANN